jgi:hypothetical protein
MSDGPILSALARLEAKMDAEFTGLRTEMSAFRSSVTDELGKTRGAIAEKLADVQASLTAVRDDIAVDMGGVDAARLVNDNTREGMKQMREQVSVMWKQVKALEAKVRGITGEP